MLGKVNSISRNHFLSFDFETVIRATRVSSDLYSENGCILVVLVFEILFSTLKDMGFL